MSLTRGALALSLMFGGLAATADAATIFSTGEGSAVTTADRSATFDTLTGFIDLSNYSEDGLSIAVPDMGIIGFDAFGDGTMTAFHYGNGGNYAYVTIKGTDDAVFDAVEFKLGDGNLFGATTNLLWQTLLNGVVVGSGFEASLAKGTVVGWSDSSGFDELRVAAASTLTGTSVLGDFQAIALDNVNAQLATVPEPATLGLLGMGAVALGGRAWRRRRSR